VQEAGISVEHYNGQAWSYVRSPSLNGFYEGIRVTSPTSIWITEIVGRANKPYLLHGNGSTWTKTALPGLSLQAPVPDGAGGVWTVVTVKSKVLAVHLTRTGKLTSFAIGPAARDRIGELAQLPRTSSVALAGNSPTAKGSNAVVWAYGKL
jgi:hypothetical protein